VGGQSCIKILDTQKSASVRIRIVRVRICMQKKSRRGEYTSLGGARFVKRVRASDYLEGFVYHGESERSERELSPWCRREDRDFAYKWQHHASRYARNRKRERNCYTQTFALLRFQYYMRRQSMLQLIHLARIIIISAPKPLRHYTTQMCIYMRRSRTGLHISKRDKSAFTAPARSRAHYNDLLCVISNERTIQPTSKERRKQLAPINIHNARRWRFASSRLCVALLNAPSPETKMPLNGPDSAFAPQDPNSIEVNTLQIEITNEMRDLTKCCQLNRWG
jgi:hypothetical protein